MKLTPKQEKFALAYHETGNASEAYRRSYKADRMSASAIKVEASRLLDHPNVALTVHRLRAEAEERAQLSVDWVLANLREVVEGGAGVPPSVRVRALELLGKHLGMFRETIDLTLLRREAERVAEENGLDADELVAEAERWLKRRK